MKKRFKCNKQIQKFKEKWRAPMAFGIEKKIRLDRRSTAWAKIWAVRRKKIKREEVGWRRNFVWAEDQQRKSNTVFLNNTVFSCLHFIS